VEHESQYVCSGCLARATAPSEKATSKFGKAFVPVMAGGAFLGSWFFFYMLGQWILKAQ